jgi:hypothetical protein
MLPHSNDKGNAYRTVQYQADGEASDWILSEHGIIAASPELGTNDRKSENFFIMDRSVLLEILNQNAPWILKSFKKLGAQLGFNHLNTAI